MANRPDPIQLPLRLGCGALLGLCLATPIAWTLSRRILGTLDYLVPMIAAGVVLCAVLAAIHGERFWDWWRGTRYRWFDRMG